jgi:hypothetical protein
MFASGNQIFRFGLGLFAIDLGHISIGARSPIGIVWKGGHARAHKMESGIDGFRGTIIIGILIVGIHGFGLIGVQSLALMREQVPVVAIAIFVLQSIL